MREIYAYCKNGVKKGVILRKPLIFEEDKLFLLKVAGFIANRVAFNPPSGPGKQQSFSRFIIRLSVVATVISVAVMIITLSLANGFQQTVSRKVFSFLGHIRILEKEPGKMIISEETIIEKNDSLINQIRHNPAVESVHPYATKAALLKSGEGMEGILMKGIDSSFDYSHFSEFMKEGKLITFNDSSYSRDIILSKNIADRLKVKTGSQILIYFIKPDKIRPDKLTVAGIYNTGIEDYDKSFVLGDIRLIQQLNRDSTMEDPFSLIGGYEIFLKDYHQIKKVSDEIYDMDDFPQTWNTVPVQEISPNIFDWLNLMDINRNVLMVIMIVIAIINMMTCLIILVLERIRMIGVLKALGATNWTIQKIFLRHSLIITGFGIIIGTALGLGLLFLQMKTGFIRLQEDAYYMSTAAVKIDPLQVLAVGAATLLLTFLVLMIPSLLVRKIRPVQAIQFR